MKISLIVLWLLCMTSAIAEPLQDQDIEVKVQLVDEKVIVDLNMLIPATREEAWAVLTDFDHMAEFVSNLKESKIVGINGDKLTIFQRGSASYGLVDYSFESTRDATLTTFTKIESHLIKGTMLAMEATTQLAEEGVQTRIIYHNESVPGRWIPPIVGKRFIEHETRKQYQEIKNEVIKRKQR